MKPKSIFGRSSAIVAGLVTLLALVLSPSVPVANAASPNFPTFTQQYKVVQGDSLWSLAAKFGTTVNDLSQANNISDPSKLSIGEQLWVPPAPVASSAAGAAPAKAPGLSAPPTAYPTFTQQYTIVQGDNLWNLAKKFGTTVNDLAAANSISDPTKLSIGEQLWVPAAPAASAPAMSAPAKAPGMSTPPAAYPTFTQQYTIVQGDSLSSLAAKFGTTVNDLATANSISDPSKLSIGEQLWVPTAPAASAPAMSAPAKAPGLSAPPATYPSFTQQYTVVQGDNLGTLAKKFNTTVNDLAAANSISDPSKLSIGEQLWVPAASTAPAAPAAPANPGM